MGIYRSVGKYQRDFGSVFAFMILATLPVLVFYLLFRKYFIRGLTGGATKGVDGTRGMAGRSARHQSLENSNG